MGCVKCCTRGTMKYSIIALSVLYVLTGITFLAWGTMYKVGVDVDVLTLGGFDFSTVPYLLMAIGVITIFISLLGCCGAIKENSCIVQMYGIILFVLMILHLSTGVYAFVSMNRGREILEMEVNEYTDKIFEDYHEDGEAKKAVDRLQQWLHCCGRINKDEWLTTHIPKSCCDEDERVCTYLKASNIGCNDELYDRIEIKTKITGYVTIGLCSTEIIAIFFSFCFSRSIKNS